MVMKPEDRIKHIPTIRDMAERYFAIACHDLLLELEKDVSFICVSNHAALQYRKGMNKYFQMKVTVDGEIIRM